MRLQALSFRQPGAFHRPTDGRRDEAADLPSNDLPAEEDSAAERLLVFERLGFRRTGGGEDAGGGGDFADIHRRSAGEPWTPPQSRVEFHSRTPSPKLRRPVQDTTAIVSHASRDSTAYLDEPTAGR
ncbi:MAG: hypothetical protein ACRDD1_14280 [Planctomycetia bacterium]